MFISHAWCGMGQTTLHHFSGVRPQIELQQPKIIRPRVHMELEESPFAAWCLTAASVCIGISSSCWHFSLKSRSYRCKPCSNLGEAIYTVEGQLLLRGPVAA